MCALTSQTSVVTHFCSGYSTAVKASKENTMILYGYLLTSEIIFAIEIEWQSLRIALGPRDMSRHPCNHVDCPVRGLIVRPACLRQSCSVKQRGDREHGPPIASSLLELWKMVEGRRLLTSAGRLPKHVSLEGCLLVPCPCSKSAIVSLGLKW